jgi:manganese transport protein
VRLVRQNKADLLVIGAHGHKGIRDVVYGQTVDEVRHSLRIPVLIITI